MTVTHLHMHDADERYSIAILRLWPKRLKSCQSCRVDQSASEYLVEKTIDIVAPRIIRNTSITYNPNEIHHVLTYFPFSVEIAFNVGCHVKQISENMQQALKESIMMMKGNTSTDQYSVIRDPLDRLLLWYHPEPKVS